MSGKLVLGVVVAASVVAVPMTAVALGPSGHHHDSGWGQQGWHGGWSGGGGGGGTTIPVPTTTTTTKAPATTARATTTTKAPATTARATTTTKAPATTAGATTTAPAGGPVAGAFPSANNTGVPAGVALKPSGGLNITQAGTVIDALDIQGSVWIGASNVTIKRSRIRNGDFNTIRVADGVTGVVLQDVEINGLGQTSGNNGVYGQATIQRANIWNVENGVVLDSGSLLVDSYIHDLASVGDPHYDGVQLDGGRSNITIRHNTIISNPLQTSAVMIDNGFGPIANIVVDGNKLAGGGYTVYSDAQFTGGPITGVQVINNRFGQHQFGYALIRGNSLLGALGNVDDITGKAISIA